MSRPIHTIARDIRRDWQRVNIATHGAPWRTMGGNHARIGTKERDMNIADDYARTKAQIDALEENLKCLRRRILAEGKEMVRGENCALRIQLSERVTLDSGIVRAMLSPEQVAKAERRSVVETIRIKPIIAESV